MNVYVETNFVLELALAQEQASQCEELLELAEQSRIQLILPAYSLAEPHETLVRRQVSRDVDVYEVSGRQLLRIL